MDGLPNIITYVSVIIGCIWQHRTVIDFVSYDVVSSMCYKIVFCILLGI